MAEKLTRSIVEDSRAMEARSDVAELWIDMIRVFRNQVDVFLENPDGEPPSKEFVDAMAKVSDQVRRDTCIDGSEKEAPVELPKKMKKRGGKTYKVVG